MIHEYLVIILVVYLQLGNAYYYHDSKTMMRGYVNARSRKSRCHCSSFHFFNFGGERTDGFGGGKKPNEIGYSRTT